MIETESKINIENTELVENPDQAAQVAAGHTAELDVNSPPLSPVEKQVLDLENQKKLVEELLEVEDMTPSDRAALEQELTDKTLAYEAMKQTLESMGRIASRIHGPKPNPNPEDEASSEKVEKLSREEIQAFIVGLNGARSAGGKNGQVILGFDVPDDKAPIDVRVEPKIGEHERQYTIVNLIGVGRNDNVDGGGGIETVRTAIDTGLGHVDRITEGGAQGMNDVTDYGTEDLTVGDNDYTIRVIKLDGEAAQRIVAYAIYDKTQARGEGPEASRVLIVTKRTSNNQHDEIAEALANWR